MSRSQNDEERPLLAGDDAGLGHTFVEDEPASFLDAFCACLGVRERTLFDPCDKDVLWHLRRQVVNKPKPGDEELQSMFVAVWNAAFPDEQKTTFEVGEHWKRLGFQGRDPKTDVRTGAWPAQQLATFAERHRAQFQQMVKVSSGGGQSEYLLAIAFFNVSHMLSMYFDLVTVNSVSPLPNATTASKHQLKHFTALVVNECEANGNQGVSTAICQRVLDEVFAEVMLEVHRAWMEMTQASGAAVTLLDFPKALRKGFDANDAFWKRSCKNLNDLKIKQGE
eukprot:TRINITY_DN75600_c0_g1_i1.p1 TRINITY_DN75600_c0_g1~~TRINITY_DN75600_c0_g1_i1.p1  ORF type:complete len:280 (+),score=53.91 TRINITY_DN75600_c0_g1_i1:83-922(+)